MPSPQALTESQIEWAVQLYENGWTIKSIARHFHVAEPTIHRYFSLREVPRRNRGKRPGDMQALDAKREEIFDMHFLYMRMGLSLGELSEVYPICRSAIPYRFRRFGLPVRTKSEVSKLCAAKKRQNLKLAS